MKSRSCGAPLNIYPVEWRLWRPSFRGFHRGFVELERSGFNRGNQRITLNYQL
jgi:hypothetical protein